MACPTSGARRRSAELVAAPVLWVAGAFDLPSSFEVIDQPDHVASIQPGSVAGLRELRLYTNVAMLENLTLYPHLGYTEIARRTEAGFQRVLFSKATTLPPES
jgi:hypothetical protein